MVGAAKVGVVDVAEAARAAAAAAAAVASTVAATVAAGREVEKVTLALSQAGEGRARAVATKVAWMEAS